MIGAVSLPISAQTKSKPAANPIDFNRDIRPLLSDNCFHCHGPDENTREADLRMDVEADAKQLRGDYRVIDAGSAIKSEMVQRVFSDDDDLLMPPADSGKKLTDRQKTLLKDWVNQGAPWSQHWAYEPPRKHTVPKIDSDWSYNFIDNFILSRLHREELTPVADAAPVTLLRRLYFDLTGLPPTQSDVEAFLKDDSPDRLKRLTQNLLNSEHFGERMAIYWLDLVRYADTVGYHGDQDQNISPYRDWVIQAFNSNMPFDQFTREQLAGDLLPHPTESQLVATGYNRLLQTTHEGGLQPAEYRAIYAADRVRNLSAVWMGGTLGCAQCHDHKYDPYTAKDFYSMAAFFADVDDERHFKNGTNALPTRREPEIRVYDRETQLKMKELESQILKAKTSSPKDSAIAAWQNELDALKKQGRLTMITKALNEPRETRILPRGNFLDKSGSIVQPAVPEFMLESGPLNSGKRASRLDLANWLTDHQNGSGLLTARVFVNRVWYLMFGTGLTPNLDDFGGQGQPPTHPELLDQLAIYFVENDWDVKKLIQLIVSSRTYQLSSKAPAKYYLIDPNNQLFARQTHFRLPAEMIRDNALAVSGLLVKKIGGSSIRPYQPPGYYRNLNFPIRKYSPSKDQKQYQRGVYVHWQRQFLHPMLRAFDAPRREECTAERARSNTPIAALVLLNDPSFVEAARVLAERVVDKKLSDDESIQLAFKISLSRQADPFESKQLTKLFQESKKIYAQNPEWAKELLGVGLTESSVAKQNRDGEILAKAAALIQVVRVIFNLDEFVSRR